MKSIYLYLTAICFLAIISFQSYVQYNQKNIYLLDPYLNGKFPASAPRGDSAWGYEIAFPNLPSFGSKVTEIQEFPPGNRMYVLGKEGFVWSFVNNSDVDKIKLVLSFSDSVYSTSDGGLVGMAFHPEFNDNNSNHFGEVYFNYTFTLDKRNDTILYDRLSRFQFNGALDAIDRNSEEVIIQQVDQHRWHNGGSIFFDKTGYLYMTVGDEGGFKDFYENSQKIDKALFSGILRIDVDLDSSRSHSIRRFPKAPEVPEGWPGNINQNYMIPNDNPWLDDNGGVLEEFFAIGLRNPFRIYYDSITNEIWVADVGQSRREEITLISKGSNAQWSYMEGTLTGFTGKPDSIIGIETPPILEYGRDMGRAVIGGMVYRANKYPSLYGKYIFGDHATNNIWAYDQENDDLIFLCNIPSESQYNGIVSFCTDSQGEIYVLKLFGDILKLKKLESLKPPPATLSKTEAFTDLDLMTPMRGILPYDINTPFWSDRAQKKRWISLPSNSEGIHFSEDSAWIFPVGTVFIKHFELPLNESNPDSTVKIETRFLIVGENGDPYGLTYKWNDTQTEANLISSDKILTKEFLYKDGAGAMLSQTWSFPSRQQCLTCHNANAGFVLGVKTSQLNKNFKYATGENKNQLNVLNQLEFFSETLNDEDILSMLKLVSLTDTSASDELKVRSYLESNCSYCHRPSGVEAAFDARIRISLEYQKIINEPVAGRHSSPDNFIVKPGDLDHSELWIRANSLDETMPPLAKSILDNEFLDILERWILNIACYESEATNRICSGGSFTFPDGTVMNDIITPVIHTSQLQTIHGCDSLIFTSIEIDPIFESETTHEICSGDSFTSPDGTEIINITSSITHVSQFQTVNGCDSLLISNIYIECVLGVYDIEQMINLYPMYPNPTEGTLTIRGFGRTKDIKIFNMAGIEVKNYQVCQSNDNIEVNLSELDDGQYIMRLLSFDNKVYKGRFIKD